MKPLSQRAGTWFAAGMVLAVAGLPARGESFAVGDQPPTAKRIDLNVDLQPSNPFADANKAGAPREFSRGDVIRLVIQGTPHPGFHTYPLTTQYKDESGNVNTISYSKKDDLQPLWPITETPPPESIFEEGVGFYLEHRKPFTWTQDIYIKPEATPGPHVLGFTLHLQVCDTNCVFGDHAFEVPFQVIDGPPAAPLSDLQQRLQVAKPPVALVSPPPPSGFAPSPPPKAEPPHANAKGESTATAPINAAAPAAGGFWDLIGFMWQGVIFGAVSLLTPCVFPMIPITVSYFLKQSEKSNKRAHADPDAEAGPVRKTYSPVLLAAVYSSTIALVLTVAGLLLLPLVQKVSQHWATNLGLGSLFIFFALSLFGMYDIVLPSWLGRLTAAGEGRGGVLGVVFMALTFTVISFACVAPFYGGFIALTASAASASDWLKLVLGALAFSVTFALPFFVLALFPALLKALPKSGSWLNTVKVVMGFLELAAAFKFLRAAEINYFVKSEFLTYDLVLGIYIALSVACGLYLLGVYRLPHDHGAPESLGVPRLLFSIAFLGLALYLLPGLFKTTVDNQEEQQRPDGTVFAWLDAFLLPENSDLPWVGDLQAGLKQAEAENKLVFLDFTAQTCTNCKYNERNIFIQAGVKNLLTKYVLVHLYTDNVPPEYKSSATGADNLQFMQQKFQDAQLPLYAILKPKGDGGYEVVGAPYKEGKINDVNGFAKFLQEPLQPPADARAESKGG